VLRPTALTVIPKENYTLEVSFDNGETRYFDVKPYIKGEWYSELKDPDYFKTIKVNGYTVEWKNGQDICPDELFYCSEKIPEYSVK